jgi:membrane associated rhomboid family serine protease
MLFLSVFGNVVEKEANGKITLLAFFTGGVGSLIVSSFYYGFNIVMIGASGAIFTLAAAAMLIKPLKLSLLFFFIPLGLVAILYFIFNVFAVIFEFGGNVGYAAHVAGFLIGIPFGIAFSKGEWIKNLGITILLLIAFLAAIYAIQIAFNLL